jgi:hypothetical protein
MPLLSSTSSIRNHKSTNNPKSAVMSLATFTSLPPSATSMFSTTTSPTVAGFDAENALGLKDIVTLPEDQQGVEEDAPSIPFSSTCPATTGPTEEGGRHSEVSKPLEDTTNTSPTEIEHPEPQSQATLGEVVAKEAVTVMAGLNRVVLCALCARDWRRGGSMGFCAPCATSMIGWGGEVAMYQLAKAPRPDSGPEDHHAETTSKS